ncbi:sugar nucleotide-binding protein [Pelomonas sp. SE-A7]|uniref:sugar nucleotide-binding protein n=1 Tax=Pelomonas sp. SE-A7 TaxID=3054953 RepID=UPI00259D2480|nr:sugar nucleotide-binding protein [Pelomonas sp. SE-A7]MDM4764649.1 sugar nucleotide-binding protein [Pelomonas sp. SE-A7]
MGLRRLLVTGLGGTLAPHLARAAEAAGWQVLGWDRRRIPVDDEQAVAAHLQASRPDAIAHLALGSPSWSRGLAEHAAQQGLPLLYTSTVMVFDHEPDGPHRPQDERTSKDDYGRSKIAGEDAIRGAHPGACIARIGWQIDEHSSGNNMLATLEQWQREQGRIAASRAWIPACSFMTDTAQALLALIEEPAAAGRVVHLDSNAESALSFDQVVQGLARRFERKAWRIEVNEDYRHDQRLADAGPARLPSLTDRLAQKP